MTQTFATNSNNDLYIGNDGNLVIFTGINAVLQACSNAAKAQLGEMVLAIDQGVPNFQLIWKGAPNIPQWEAALITTLEEVDGVDHVESVTVTIINNVLTYIATIVTIYGTGEING